MIFLLLLHSFSCPWGLCLKKMTIKNYYDFRNISGRNRGVHSSVFTREATHLLSTQLCCGFCPCFTGTAPCPWNSHSQAPIVRPPGRFSVLIFLDLSAAFDVAVTAPFFSKSCPSFALMTLAVLGFFPISGPSSQSSQQVPSPYSASK